MHGWPNWRAFDNEQPALAQPKVHCAYGTPKRMVRQPFVRSSTYCGHEVWLPQTAPLKGVALSRADVLAEICRDVRWVASFAPSWLRQRATAGFQEQCSIIALVPALHVRTKDCKLPPRRVGQGAALQVERQLISGSFFRRPLPAQKGGWASFSLQEQQPSQGRTSSDSCGGKQSLGPGLWALLLQVTYVSGSKCSGHS